MKRTKKQRTCVNCGYSIPDNDYYNDYCPGLKLESPCTKFVKLRDALEECLKSFPDFKYIHWKPIEVFLEEKDFSMEDV